ncbi:MAG: hypothetical protein Q9201_007668 [Fulgogasparrea decipioides]
MADSKTTNVEESKTFARLSPEGLNAEQALDVVCKNPSISEYHRAYLHVERKQRFVEASSDSDQASKPPAEQIGYWAGYYSLALNDRLQHGGLAPWRVGRGTSRFNDEDRGVDLLLIGPKDKSYGIGAVQAIIRFHPRSGVLILAGVLDEKPVQYMGHEGRGKVYLGKGQQRVLWRQRNEFKLGNLEYALEFEPFTAEEHSTFRTFRDSMYQRAQQIAPHPSLSAIPRMGDRKLGPLITHGTLDSGKFGWVYVGVDAVTGEPLAIKEQSSVTPRDLDRVMSEITIAYQKVYSASPLVVGDFRHFRGHNFTISQFLEFYRGPLQGLQHLHGAGMMHRDVHFRNLLVISMKPPVAVLCDFGKALEAPVDTNQHLGPISTRAPEIDGVRPYNNKIDIWSLGFSCCEIALPGLQRELNRDQHISREWHARTTKYLQQRSSESLDDSLAIDLLLRMLTWDPAERISAAEALRHPYFATSLASPGILSENRHHKAQSAGGPLSSQSKQSSAPKGPTASQSIRHPRQPHHPISHIPLPIQDTQYDPRSQRHLPIAHPPPAIRDVARNPYGSHPSSEIERYPDRLGYRPTLPPSIQAPQLTGYGQHTIDRLGSSESVPRSSSSAEAATGASMLAFQQERQRQRFAAASNTNALLHPAMERR